MWSRKRPVCSGVQSDDPYAAVGFRSALDDLPAVLDELGGDRERTAFAIVIDPAEPASLAPAQSSVRTPLPVALLDEDREFKRF